MNSRVATALALVLGSISAGCYAPSFADCELRCSTAGTCPDGQSCDGQFCRAPNAPGVCNVVPIDASMGGEALDLDRDDDTINDDVDNCPTVPNRLQENEDRDMFGNVCDPCPPFGPPGNADGDSDGVGDGCDPNPAMPGDAIVMFEGFDSTMPPGGALATGNLNYMNGQLVMTGNPSAPLAALMWPVTLSPGRLVMSGFTVDALTGPPALIGVADRFTPSGSGAGVSCEAGLSSNSAPVLVPVELPGTERMGTSIQIGNGASRIVSLRRTGNTYTCRLEPGGISVPYTSGTNATQSMIHAGIRSRSTTSRVDWVLIVNSP